MADVFHLNRWRPPKHSKVAGNCGTGSIGPPGFSFLVLSVPMPLLVTDLFKGVGTRAGASFCFFGGFGSLCVTCTHLLKSTGSLGWIGVLLSDSFVLAFSSLIRIVFSSTGRPHRSSGGPRILQVFFQVLLVHSRTATGT